MQPQRLFDAIEHQLNKFPKQDALVEKINGQWKKYSTQTIKDIVDRFSAGLLSLGLSQNDGTPEGLDKIAIISNNRPQWLFADMACQQLGLAFCPIYPTTNPLEMEFIFNDSQIKYAFVSNAEMYEKTKAVQAKVPTLKNIYTFDEVAGAPNWQDVLALATPDLLAKMETIKAGITSSHLATIIYTSGTTGTPKGVMLSHGNICSNVYNSKLSFPFEDAPNSKVLSFLPLNHIFEKTCSYIYLFSGISIWYAESLETIADNLREVQPNGFTTVPRLLEKVFEKIMQKGAELTGIKKKLFDWAVGLGFKYDNLKSGGLFYNMQLALANKIIFNKWRAGLGGNIEYIITGGAAAQERLLRVFNAAKIPVYEGYGPTENSPVITVNRKEKGGSMFGTVGPAIVGQDVKLAEDGEIMVKGPSVMMGYYKRPDLTAETMNDGWLLTGDIGVWINDKYLKITDRKKELFKTSGGKYVAPQPIENKLKESPFIEQALIVGAGEKFVGALLVPSFSYLQKWMGEKNIPFTNIADAIRQPEVQNQYRDIVENYNQFFNHVEQVKKFELLPAEWSLETGEMTPKLSLKRKVIMEKYREAVARIYG